MLVITKNSDIGFFKSLTLSAILPEVTLPERFPIFSPSILQDKLV